MSKIEKTLKAYKEEKLNCAQSVLRGYQELYDVSDERILNAKQHGGGRAPEGLCGALHSALELVNDDSKAALLKEKFLNDAGALKCSEIRALKKLSCAGCVQLAAELLNKH